MVTITRGQTSTFINPPDERMKGNSQYELSGWYMAEDDGKEFFWFQWDEGNLDHIAEHGVTREEAEQVVRNRPLVVAIQNRFGEERLQQVGETHTGRVLIVVTTPRAKMVRIVTAFDASRPFRRMYTAWKDAVNDAT